MPHQRIRLARRHAAMTQAKFAAAVGVQRSAVSHWESPSGKHPSMAHLRQIALVAGVQFEWLATGRGAMPLSKEMQRDSIVTAKAVLIDEVDEMRMLAAFRATPHVARTALIEVMEQMARQRIGFSRHLAVMVESQSLVADDR